MEATDRRPRKSPDIKWKRIGRTGILLDLRTGDYFELDETALTIWNMLDGKISVARVVGKLAKTYSASVETVERDVIRFISELRKRKLIDAGEG